jgi:hypothetical protein
LPYQNFIALSGMSADLKRSSCRSVSSCVRTAFLSAFSVSTGSSARFIFFSSFRCTQSPRLTCWYLGMALLSSCLFYAVFYFIRTLRSFGRMLQGDGHYGGARAFCSKLETLWLMEVEGFDLMCSKCVFHSKLLFRTFNLFRVWLSDWFRWFFKSSGPWWYRRLLQWFFCDRVLFREVYLERLVLGIRR